MRTSNEIRAELEKVKGEYGKFRHSMSCARSPFEEKKIEELEWELRKAVIKEQQEKQIEIEEYYEVVKGIPLDRLKNICEAEKSGKLRVLPCSVGDTV